LEATVLAHSFRVATILLTAVLSGAAVAADAPEEWPNSRRSPYVVEPSRRHPPQHSPRARLAGSLSSAELMNLASVWFGEFGSVKWTISALRGADGRPTPCRHVISGLLRGRRSTWMIIRRRRTPADEGATRC